MCLVVAEEADELLDYDDYAYEDEDTEQDVELSAFAGFFCEVLAELDCHFLLFDLAFLEALGADLHPVVGLVELVEGAHPAAVGAAALGDGVALFVDAVAVLAPVTDGVFKPAVTAQVFPALAALFGVAVVGLDFGEVHRVITFTAGTHGAGL
jgi:hypothetical protein